MTGLRPLSIVFRASVNFLLKRSACMFGIFDLPITHMLPASFKSIGLSVQEKKHEIDFLRWQPSLIFDLNNFSYI